MNSLIFRGDPECSRIKIARTSNSNSNKLISAEQQQPPVHHKSFSPTLRRTFGRRSGRNSSGIWNQSCLVNQEQKWLTSCYIPLQQDAPSISDFKLEKRLCRRRAAPKGHLMNQPSGWLMVKRERSGESYATSCQHQAGSSRAWLNKRSDVQWVATTCPDFPFLSSYFWFSYTTAVEGREQSQGEEASECN